MRLAEEVGQSLDHDLPDPVDRGELGDRLRFVRAGAAPHVTQGVDRAEMAGEQPGIRLADMADAERIDEPVETDLPARLDRGEQVLGALLPPTLAVLQLGQAPPVALAQGKNVLRTSDEALAVELVNALPA